MDLTQVMSACNLCPHNCNVNRLKNEKGFCKAAAGLEIESYLPHFGEEPELTGSRGSGTIFFSKCNMRCVYCQNFQISQQDNKKEAFLTIEDLADIMLELQAAGCHNINLVSPTIWSAHIIEALDYTKKELELPVIYNTGGYEKPETIKMLEGYINIYMPDIRYAGDLNARQFSGINNYKKYSRASLKEMYSQVGNLVTDKNNIAVKGLMVRLLILPDNIAEVKKTLDYISSELSNEIYISLMSQYRPAYKAGRFTKLSRPINYDEYMSVVNHAEKLGFCNGSIQEFTGSGQSHNDPFIPDFSRDNVFEFNNKNKID